MTNWDDARFVLALARSGTIRAAAKNLAVNHTTVSRRIATLEQQLSARLFEQTPMGYVLTASGKIIVDAAQAMEDLILGSQQRIEGSDTNLTGEVHINIPDIFDDWVCEALAQFLQQHPKLKIHLRSELTVADLARREADIALRFTNSPPQDMVGQKVWQLPTAVYASSDSKFNDAKKLSSYPWVRWTPEFSDSSIEQWTDKKSVGCPAVTRVCTYKTLSTLVRYGAGVGCLCPQFADTDPNLIRLTDNIKNVSLDVWVLTHPDLRGVKRIKAVKDLLIDMFERKI